MKSIKFLILVFLTAPFLGHSQMSESGALGLGVAWTNFNYGVSAKYNFTETHTGQVVIGSGDFVSVTGASSFSLTGRYLYNFEEGDIDFATWKPYLFGQLGYWKSNYDLGSREISNSSVVLGFGGGIEWSFNDFVDGLAFVTELGFATRSLYGFNWGWGVHYYFDL